MYIQRKSHAKINLFLNVVGKDAKNMHLLQSYFKLLPLADVISITPSKSLQVQMQSSNFKLNVDMEDNIVTKAVRMLQRDYNIQEAVKIVIQKNIPTGAGMGGASSNAAVILKMLNEMWSLNMSFDMMLKYARNLGADVSFFLYDSDAFVSGIGDVVEPMQLKCSLPILIVWPGFSISTKAAYEEYSKNADFSKVIANTYDSILESIMYGKNDLYMPALSIEPRIKEVIDILNAQQGSVIARMSGSGSSCFAIFESEEEKNITYRRLSTSEKFMVW